MHKLSSRSAAAHRRPTVRHARNEEIAHVIISLQNAGKIAVHTVKSIAAMMYGDDCILDTRHISAARRMIDKIQKMKFPLEPCGEDGVLISKAEAWLLSLRRGRQRPGRGDPGGHGRHAIEEGRDRRAQDRVGNGDEPRRRGNKGVNRRGPRVHTSIRVPVSGKRTSGPTVAQG